jgi:hypothetical protein
VGRREFPKRESSRDLALVNDPFESGAVAEAVFVCFFRNAAQRKKLVIDERGLVLAQPHFSDAVIEFFSGLFRLYERVIRLLFVADVDLGQALAGFCKSTECVFCVACEPRSPATAFGRVELSFVPLTPDFRPGLSYAAPSGLGPAEAEAMPLPAA